MIGQTNLVFSAVCVTSDDIESTQSIGELLSVDVDTFVKTHIVVVHTAVVEDVDHVRFDIFTRDSQGSAFVLHDEDGISTCLIGSGPFFFYKCVDCDSRYSHCRRRHRWCSSTWHECSRGRGQCTSRCQSLGTGCTGFPYHRLV